MTLKKIPICSELQIIEDRKENGPPKLTDKRKSVNVNLNVVEAKLENMKHLRLLSRTKKCPVCLECQEDQLLVPLTLVVPLLLILPVEEPSRAKQHLFKNSTIPIN